MCSALGVLWVCVVCSLHPRMTDPRDNTCNFNGRGGYSLGGSAGAGSWKCWPEASVTGIGACRGGGSTTLGRAGGGAAAPAGLHLALDWALRWPPVLVEHWEAEASLSSMGEESGHPRPNPVEFPFLSSVNVCAINIFPFPFWIQNLVQGGGS